jgi:hypothetical protein
MTTFRNVNGTNHGMSRQNSSSLRGGSFLSRGVTSDVVVALQRRSNGLQAKDAARKRPKEASGRQLRRDPLTKRCTRFGSHLTGTSWLGVPNRQDKGSAEELELFGRFSGEYPFA